MGYVLFAIVMLCIIKNFHDHDGDSEIKFSLTKLFCIEYKKSQRKNP